MIELYTNNHFSLHVLNNMMKKNKLLREKIRIKLKFIEKNKDKVSCLILLNLCLSLEQQQIVNIIKILESLAFNHKNVLLLLQ